MKGAYDPPIAALVEALAASSEEEMPDASHDERRQQADETMLLVHPGRPDGTVCTDHVVGERVVRVLRPPSAPATGAPALFFVHGGGWFQGTVETAEVELGPVYGPAGCVVVTPEYRLSPEHVFPAALDDVVAAFEWFLANLDDLGVDPARVAVGGTSAGGNLCAALTLVIKERGWPMPVLQLLDVPALDLTLQSPSHDEYVTGAGLTKAGVDEYAGWYAGDTPRAHPLVSPLFAEDLAGLPPAVIVMAEHDPVRDDGERYLARLWAAGVPGAAVRVIGHFHGGWVIPGTMTARLVTAARIEALRAAFGA
ncbi:MAG TPA: alpha/beta hydrolase [Acidimicrobiales bacterium]|nr:alpha/beta hydrolase [Acidimicrobiales bacterium]